MFGLNKKIFMGLLINIVNDSNHKKCVSVSNQRCGIHYSSRDSSIISLHLNEYSQEAHYYLFAIELDRCVGSYNSLNVSSNKICIPDKTESLNLSVFNMIIGIMESKALAKHV